MPRRLKTDISYTPLRVSNMNIKDVRKAYTTLRRLAQARMESLKRKGFTSYEVYKNAKRYLQGLPKAKGLSTGEVRQLLVETSLFLRKPFSKSSTIEKFEKEQVSHFNKMGFDFINRKNIRRFHKYMNNLNEKYGSKAIQSFKAVALFNQAERLNISTKVLEDDFYSWVNKVDELTEISESKYKNLKGKKNISRRIAKDLGIE